MIQQPSTHYDSSYPTRMLSDPTQSNPAQSNPAGWEIIRNFATSEMSHPEAEGHLQQVLGDDFVDSHWRPTLKAIMDVEGDAETALRNVQKLAACTHLRSGSLLMLQSL